VADMEKYFCSAPEAQTATNLQARRMQPFSRPKVKWGYTEKGGVPFFLVSFLEWRPSIAVRSACNQSF
jgi:hypothetical protein